MIRHHAVVAGWVRWCAAMQPPDRVLASAALPRAAQCHLTSDPPTTRPHPHTAAGTIQILRGKIKSYKHVCVLFSAGIHQYIICLLMFCLYRFFFLVRSLDIVLPSMIK